jgi:hypothetical protein
MGPAAGLGIERNRRSVASAIAQEGFQPPLVAEGFAAAVAVVEGFSGDRIAVNRSATALFDIEAGFAGLAVGGFCHDWLGSEGGEGNAYRPRNDNTLFDPLPAKLCEGLPLQKILIWISGDFFVARFD